MVSFHVELPNKRIDLSFQDRQGYVNALHTAAIAFLDLPNAELLNEIKDYNYEEMPLLKCIMYQFIEVLTPYEIEEWMDLLRILPYLFDTTIYPLDGNTSAKGALTHALQEDVLSELMEWDHPKAVEARQPLKKEKIDPYAHLENAEQWKNAYLALSDYGERAELRYDAQLHSIETTDWPIAEELRERYRAYRQKGKMTYEGVALRQEAQDLSIDTSDWLR
jgi:hypothetical protein